jgi:hypothetical protein
MGRTYASGSAPGRGEHRYRRPRDVRGSAPDREADSVRSFGAFTRDLHELCDWLRSCSIRIAQRERIAKVPPDRTEYEAGFGLPPRPSVYVEKCGIQLPALRRLGILSSFVASAKWCVQAVPVPSGCLPRAGCLFCRRWL